MAVTKGRNPRLISLAFAFDPRVLESLDGRAKNLRRSRSWVIREAVARYLADPADDGARLAPRALEPTIRGPVTPERRKGVR